MEGGVTVASRWSCLVVGDRLDAPTQVPCISSVLEVAVDFLCVGALCLSDASGELSSSCSEAYLIP